ncbi:MAG: ATP-dependent RNA helicase HrpA [Verrucomicrobia bacterium]|nr:ATP-dependent RNA helicase HrpA [Verrucomicrobiota bacterium]
MRGKKNRRKVVASGLAPDVKPPVRARLRPAGLHTLAPVPARRPDPPFRFRLDFPSELPISARAEEIVAAIQAHPVVILAGETGSGKTTQIPKMCLAAGRGVHGRIGCTQPRRVAALSISRRVAEELGVDWGREVGCKIRFTDQTTSATVIKFLTDGMLLAEVQGDPLLREYDTLIIDEAHERSLNIDFLLGHLRTLRHRRPELKLVITSATIDTAMFSAAFDDAPVLRVEGRTYPVEVVYAPLDALGSDAAEGDEREARAEALHYIDGAVEAVERIVRESPAGDVLVFMPSERDIREAGDLLAGRRLRDCEVVPLFGRLSNAEQQRVFAPTPHRKLVIATNIAETSLTIPGIRFVVDTGLARVSRYAPQARTRRLPIEPIAQSSADQRKGRCGRVADGVCIRLYSEADYLARPRFTQPEIQRANLADVILRLKAFGLGDIERFPFINAPAAKSVRAGYALLEELGALADDPAAAGAPALTAVGRELARLPVDPTVGRMILQARTEQALREVLVIASGLSVQDPRERPLDRQAQADAAHRRFVHPDSDFLTLFNIWEAYHDQFENLSQARLRRFCRDHFLSYTRMREWRDIHAQLLEVLRERDGFRMTSAFNGCSPDDLKDSGFGTPAYRAIHRSILAGLLGNIGVRDDEGGYRATHDRRVTLFPGSVLFARDEPRRRPAADSGDAARRAPKTPRWLMAAEIMETTRLYARTCARLDPAWALDLARHLVRVAHSEPFWNETGGRVMVKQRTRLYGLELETKAVGYGRIDPVHATEIFIREGLVNDTITFPLDFIAHNRSVRERLDVILTRTRDAGYLNLDEAAYRFYAARLAGTPVASVAELVDLVRERRGAEPRFLMMEPGDLRDPESLAHDATAFPESLPLENRALPLVYAYKPGQTEDGVTLDVTVAEAERLTPAALDWAVPGHLEAKVEHYLRSLPKELRRGFVPLAETARSLAAQVAARDRLTDRRETLPEALAAQIAQRFRVNVDPRVWEMKPLPDHLRVRIRVADAEGRELGSGRDLAELRQALHLQSRKASVNLAREDPAAWKAARSRWEKPAQTAWTFGEVPGRVPVSEPGGVPVFAFPGLRPAEGGVELRLYKTPEDAQAATARGLAALLERELGAELMWTGRDLRALRELGPMAATFAPNEELQAQAMEMLRRWVCEPSRVAALTAAAWAAAVGRAKTDLRGVVPRLRDLLREVLTLRQALLVHPTPPAGLDRDLAALLPPDFLRVTPYAQLAHFPRYLKAMKVRADRWRQNPAKDAERVAQLAPYLAAVARPSTPGRFRWLVEEYRVSLFAQELGTAEPVSQVKLDRVLAGEGATAVAREEPAARPIISAQVTERKTGRLKSLGALDQLFPR